MSESKDNVFEFAKHLTTLSFTGIGLLAVLHNQQQLNIPHKSIWFAGIFIAFALALLFAFMVMFYNIWTISEALAHKPNLIEWVEKSAHRTMIEATLAFMVGILATAIMIVINTFLNP